MHISYPDWKRASCAALAHEAWKLTRLKTVIGIAASRMLMRRPLHTASSGQQHNSFGLLLSLSFCKTPRTARWTKVP